MTTDRSPLILRTNYVSIRMTNKGVAMVFRPFQIIAPIPGMRPTQVVDTKPIDRKVWENRAMFSHNYILTFSFLSTCHFMRQEYRAADMGSE